MTDMNSVVSTLRELGLTRTEAETYLATLHEYKDGPVSGYRVAQSLGKDPANLSKTLSALEKIGAVRPIQEKPRLFVPVEPEAFTDKLVNDAKAARHQVLEQMADLEFTPSRGIPMALNSADSVLQKAAQLMSRCRREVLIFADRQVLTQLGTAWEVLVASSEVSVKLLTLEDTPLPGVDLRIIDWPLGFSEPEAKPWLQMIVDRQSWLVASFPSTGADKLPVGWWSQDPSLALIMGASLAATWDGRVDVSFEVPAVESPIHEPEIESDEIIAETETPEEPVFESMAASMQETGAPEVEEETTLEEEHTRSETPVPEESDENPNDEEEDDGIQFIIRHDDEADEEKD